jgi:hypothetical protein
LLASVIALEKGAGGERWPRRIIGSAILTWGVVILVLP